MVCWLGVVLFFVVIAEKKVCFCTLSVKLSTAFAENAIVMSDTRNEKN